MTQLVSSVRVEEEAAVLGELPPMPERSTLVPLVPRGRGTGLVEGLRHYICRLAETHSISPYRMAILLWPPDSTYPALQRRAVLGNPPSCVSGAISSQLVLNVARLTLRRALVQDTTLLPYAHLISGFALVRKRRAWCPLCLREWLPSGTAYEPLLWLVQEVTACPRHMCRLAEVCGTCGRPPSLAPVRGLYYCSCGASLADAELIAADNRELWAATEVSKLLSWPLGLIPRDGTVQQRMELLMRDPRISGVLGLARRTGSGKGQVSEWVAGKHRPSLRWWLAIAQSCGVSLAELLFAPAVEICAASAEPIVAKRRRRRHLDDAALMAVIDGARDSQRFPPPSFESVAREADVAPRTLRNRFPLETRAIVARRRAYTKWLSEIRERVIGRTVTTICDELSSRGVPTTSANVERLLVMPGLMKDPGARRALHAYRVRLESQPPS